MTREDKIKELEKELGKDSPIVVKGFLESEHKPHIFEVNDKNKLGGKVYESDLKGIRCKKKDCNLKYEDHSYKLKLILTINRDITKEEASEELFKMKVLLIDFNIETVAFVEPTENFKFL